MFNANCWRLRRAVLVIATSLLSGCATVTSEGRAVRICLPVVEYPHTDAGCAAMV
jgi:uncharacterized protein YceK